MGVGRVMALILLADDDPDILQLMRWRLERAGHQVLDTASGQQVVELAQQHRPQLVLMDVMMPELDGYQACQQLRAHPDLGGIPVVLLSARAAESDRRRGLEAGASEYLVKPFGLPQLLTLIEQLLA